MGSGAHGGSMCQASVDFEVPEREAPGLAGLGRRGWRSELKIRSERQGWAGPRGARAGIPGLAGGLYSVDNGEPPAFLSGAGRPLCHPLFFPQIGPNPAILQRGH